MITFFNRAESLSREVKILQREKANVEQQNSDLTIALQAKGIEIEVLNKHRERYIFKNFKHQSLMLEL